MLRLLVTGSEGIIGKIVVRNLTDYKIISLDKKPNIIADYIQTDLQDIDELNTQIKPFMPIDCVLHLAADSSVSAQWGSVLTNDIIATRNVFECARVNMINKVVYASTNHVTGLYESNPPQIDINITNKTFITTEMPIRPDSYYAVGKAFGEALGRYFCEEHCMQVVCLRIGTVLNEVAPNIETGV